MTRNARGFSAEAELLVVLEHTIYSYTVLLSFSKSDYVQGVMAKKRCRHFAPLTFDLSVGNLTLTPRQGAVHILFTGTCHDPPGDKAKIMANY